jgi:hypothetical protein
MEEEILDYAYIENILTNIGLTTKKGLINILLWKFNLNKNKSWKSKEKQFDKESIELFFWEKLLFKSEKDVKNLLNSNKELLTYIKDCIKSWKPGNIKLFFWENWIIENKEDLEGLFKSNKEILNKISFLLIWWEIENMRLFFWKEWIIKNKEDLKELMETEEINNILYLIENWKSENMRLFFWKEWIIKNKEDLIYLVKNKRLLYKLGFLIDKWKYENIYQKKILWYQKYKRFRNIS